MTTPDPSTEANESLDATAKLTAGLDKLAMLAEATAGYRKKLVDGGVGPDAADQMAAEYHTALMEIVTTQMKAQVTAQVAALTTRLSQIKRGR